MVALVDLMDQLPQCLQEVIKMKLMIISENESPRCFAVFRVLLLCFLMSPPASRLILKNLLYDVLTSPGQWKMLREVYAAKFIDVFFIIKEFNYFVLLFDCFDYRLHVWEFVVPLQGKNLKLCNFTYCPGRFL